MNMEQALHDALGSLERHVPDAGQVADRVRLGTVARRRRTRARLAAAGTAGMAAAVAAGTLIATSAASAPSAYAAVSAAASRTFSASYHVVAVTATRGGSMHVTGDFDPGRNAGAVRVSPGAGQVRFVGGHAYFYDYHSISQAWEKGHFGDQEAARLNDPCEPVLCGGHWIEDVKGLRVKVPKGFTEVTFAAPGTNGPPLPSDPRQRQNMLWARMISGLTGLTQDSPASLLALLRSATTVRADGPASGAGWTGTRYSFRMTLYMGMYTGFSGTVDIDQLGRVRHLQTVTETDGDPGNPAKTNDMTFSDYGTPVSVAAPPASQVTKEPIMGFNMLTP